MGIKKDIKEHKISNIIRGWITSLFVGIPLVFFSIALPLKVGVLTLSWSPDWYVRVGIALVGLLALLAPDKLPTVISDAINIIKNKVVGMVLLPFALAMLFGIKGCTKTVSSSHTTTYRDTSIFVQGETVKASVSDSLLKALLELQKAGKEPIIVYKNGKDSKTELIFSLDSLGKMQADCTTNDRYVNALIKETKEKQTILQENAREGKFIIFLLAISNVVLLAVLLIIVLKK